MPSAAKKRKAAKKKKVKEADINPSTNSHRGNDDLKPQDEKGSDGGEGSSSANPDPDDPSDIESVGLAETKEDIVVKIERELKSEQSSDSKQVSVEYTESAGKSNDGNKNSSATSIYESLSENNCKGEPFSSLQEATVSENLGKSTDSAPARMTLITEDAPFKATNNSVKAVSSVSAEKSSDTGTTLLEKSAVATVEAADTAMTRNDDKVYPFSDKNVGTSSLEEPKPMEYDCKVAKSSFGNPFTESADGKEHTKDSETPECSENQPLVASGPPVRKTSWLSCCGLFEVLGSNR